MHNFKTNTLYQFIPQAQDHGRSDSRLRLFELAIFRSQILTQILLTSKHSHTYSHSQTITNSAHTHTHCIASQSRNCETAFELRATNVIIKRNAHMPKYNGQKLNAF